MSKQSLISIIQERYPKRNESELRSLIIQGKVFVNDQKVTKPGTVTRKDSRVELKESTSMYVSRAGNKLASIWEKLSISVRDRVVMDIGVSTGGFTDFLLRHEPKGVIGVDVAYGIADIKLRNHPKVALIERQNARYLTRSVLEVHRQKNNWPSDWIDSIDVMVMDVSFIHSIKCIAPLLELLKRPADILVLIKPQFEANKEEIESGGVITDPVIHQTIIDRTINGYKALHLDVMGIWNSEVKGPKGNQEVFVWLKMKE